MELNDLRILLREETGALFFIRARDMYLKVVPCVVKRKDGDFFELNLSQGDVKLRILKGVSEPKDWGYKFIPITEEHLDTYSIYVLLGDSNGIK